MIKSAALSLYCILCPLTFLAFLNAWRTEWFGLEFLILPFSYGLILAAFSLSEKPGFYTLPGIIPAAIGALVTLVVYSFEDVLEPSDFFANACLNFSPSRWAVFAFLLAEFAAFVWIFIKSASSADSDKHVLAISTAAFAGVFAFGALSFGESGLSIALLGVHVYILALGAYFLFKGVKASSLALLNIGAFTLAVFAGAKFLSDDFSMLARGVCMLLLGLLVLFANAILIFRKKERNF